MKLVWVWIIMISTCLFFYFSPYFSRTTTQYRRLPLRFHCVQLSRWNESVKCTVCVCVLCTEIVVKPVFILALSVTAKKNRCKISNTAACSIHNYLLFEAFTFSNTFFTWFACIFLLYFLCCVCAWFFFYFCDFYYLLYMILCKYWAFKMKTHQA